MTRSGALPRGIRLQNGGYRVRLSADGRQQSLGIFNTLADAKAALAIAQAEKARGQFVAPSVRRAQAAAARREERAVAQRAEVESDWEEFVHLRGPDPTRTDLADLRDALQLVRGPAFSRTREGRTRVRANRYLWADPHPLEMTQTILDVAAETARRALLNGDPRLAAEAADAGLRASHDDERVWRYAICAAHHQRDHDRVRELVASLTRHLTDLEVDPNPETNDLLDEIARPRRRRAG